MTYHYIIYEKRDKIARITLNRPEVLNALSMPLLDEVVAAVTEAEADDDIGVIIIKGAGRAFCSGYDMAPGQPDGYILRPIVDKIARHRRVHNRVTAIWDICKPVIAQVHGYCLAGGCDLIGQCDITIAAENARIGIVQARFGIAFALNNLTYKVGPQWAKMLALTGDWISGRLAERIGLVVRAVPEAELEETVSELAERIALIPPDLQALQKKVINRAIEEMGMRNVLTTAMELDNVATHTSAQQTFMRALEEKGTIEAVKERDEPFKTSPRPRVFED